MTTDKEQLLLDVSTTFERWICAMQAAEASGLKLELVARDIAVNLYHEFYRASCGLLGPNDEPSPPWAIRAVKIAMNKGLHKDSEPIIIRSFSFPSSLDIRVTETDCIEGLTGRPEETP